jgi:thiamine-monophosphate kinase
MSATPHDEFELIARLTANIPATGDVQVGIGDDAAVVQWPPDRSVVATCDAQVEGRHFLPALAAPEELGARALAVNLSDLAAMGAEPRCALVSLFVGPATETEWIERYYAGLRSAAVAYGVALIGGNIVSTPGPFSADITLLGQIEPGRALLRSSAREGDAILVTGTVGAAAAGLLAATNPQAVAHVSPHALARLREAWLRPTPRVSVGRALAAASQPTAMIDVSDGLAADLGHVLAASHLGALIEAQALPLDAATREVAQALGRDPIDLALYGGDDYELLFTVPAGAVESTHALVARLGVGVTRIGWTRPQGEGLMLLPPFGPAFGIEARGWDHFRPGAAPHLPPEAHPDNITGTPLRDA